MIRYRNIFQHIEASSRNSISNRPWKFTRNSNFVQCFPTDLFSLRCKFSQFPIASFLARRIFKHVSMFFSSPRIIPSCCCFAWASSCRSLRHMIYANTSSLRSLREQHEIPLVCGYYPIIMSLFERDRLPDATRKLVTISANYAC